MERQADMGNETHKDFSRLYRGGGPWRKEAGPITLSKYYSRDVIGGADFGWNDRPTWVMGPITISKTGYQGPISDSTLTA